MNITKKISKHLIISTLFLFSFFIQGNAQNFEDVISAGKEDASIYLENYLQPIFKGLIYDFNGGWYHSGKTHKKYGFDLTIGASAAIVPAADKVFTFRNADYSVLELDSGLSHDDLPTAMGATSTKKIAVKVPLDALGIVIPPGSSVLPANYRVATFETLDGIEDEMPIAAVPAPMVQIGLGLPSKTDIKLRYVPTIEASEDVTFNLFGVGLQHDVLQHFKLDKTPLSLSLLGAYTTATTVYAPEDSAIGLNQITTIKINAYTAQVIAGVNLKIVNFYAGLGYTAGASSTTVKGDYKYTYEITGGGTQEVTLHDPIDINYELTGMKATVGMRLNIVWFKIFADYTIQEYNAVNAGIAFSFK